MNSIIHRVQIWLLWEMDQWDYMSCTAEICVWPDWATLYNIQSLQENQWHAQKLLIEAKEYYESQGKRFGWTVALNPAMKHIYTKLNITEYE